MLVFYAALFSLPYNISTWVNLTATFAITAVATLIWLSWRLWYALSNNNNPVQYAISLTNEGIIRVIDDERTTLPGAAHQAIDNARADGISMKIHHTSQLFSWGLCIKVLRRKRKWFEKDYSHLGWILKGECCEADYRRLARAIIFARKATNSRNL